MGIISDSPNLYREKLTEILKFVNILQLLTSADFNRGMEGWAINNNPAPNDPKDLTSGRLTYKIHIYLYL